MNLSYSYHAVKRIQQRGILYKDINLIIEVGTAINDDSIVLLNHDVDREIKKRKKEIEMLERLRSVRIVLGSDNTVITAYHTNRKTEKKLLRENNKYKKRCDRERINRSCTNYLNLGSN